MARIRSVHPGLFTDEGFCSVSDASRLLFIGLWTECDDRGIFEWKPLRLKMRLRPADGEQIDCGLQELEEHHLICSFEVDGKRYGAVRNFCKWQRPKAPQLVHPCPDDIAVYVAFVEQEAGEQDRGIALGRLLHGRQDGCCHYCGCEITFYRKKANSLEIDHRVPMSRGGTDDVDNLVAACKSCNQTKGALTDKEFSQRFSRSELAKISARKAGSHNAKVGSPVAKRPSQGANGEIPPQMEDGGGKREEGKHPPTPQAEPALLTPQPTPPPRDDGFQAWYASYPRKTGRGAAQRAYRAALKLATAEQLLAAVQRFAELSRGKEIQFIPHPATWLNGQRWADEELAAKPEARPQLAVVGGTPPRPRLDDPESDQWRMRLKGLRERGMWMANHWGPKPGEPGCRVPPEILAEQAA